MDTQIGSSAAGIAPAARCVVVVPCYNEAARLQPLRFSEFLAEDQQVDFLFVNDGSRDATLSVLETLRAKHPDRIQVLDKQPNGGKAEAVRMRYAGCHCSRGRPLSRGSGMRTWPHR